MNSSQRQPQDQLSCGNIHSQPAPKTTVSKNYLNVTKMSLSMEDQEQNCYSQNNISNKAIYQMDSNLQSQVLNFQGAGENQPMNDKQQLTMQVLSSKNVKSERQFQHVEGVVLPHAEQYSILTDQHSVCDNFSIGGEHTQIVMSPNSRTHRNLKGEFNNHFRPQNQNTDDELHRAVGSCTGSADNKSGANTSVYRQHDSRGRSTFHRQCIPGSYSDNGANAPAAPRHRNKSHVHLIKTQMIGEDDSYTNKSDVDSQSEMKSSMDDDIGIQLGTPDRGIGQISEEESVSRFLANGSEQKNAMSFKSKDCATIDEGYAQNNKEISTRELLEAVNMLQKRQDVMIDMQQLHIGQDNMKNDEEDRNHSDYVISQNRKRNNVDKNKFKSHTKTQGRFLQKRMFSEFESQHTIGNKKLDSPSSFNNSDFNAFRTDRNDDFTQKGEKGEPSKVSDTSNDELLIKTITRQIKEEKRNNKKNNITYKPSKIQSNSTSQGFIGIKSRFRIPQGSDGISENICGIKSDIAECCSSDENSLTIKEPEKKRQNKAKFQFDDLNIGCSKHNMDLEPKSQQTRQQMFSIGSYQTGDRALSPRFGQSQLQSMREDASEFPNFQNKRLSLTPTGKSLTPREKQAERMQQQTNPYVENKPITQARQPVHMSNPEKNEEMQQHKGKNISGSGSRGRKISSERPIVTQLVNQLEQMKKTKAAFETIVNSQSFLVELANSHTGSLALQKLITKSYSVDVVAHIVLLLVSYQDNRENGLILVMLNNYGNYFIQKVLEFCSCQQRMKLLSVISESQIVQVGTNSRGTHALQKFIQMASQDKEQNFLCEMIAKGANGSILSNFSVNQNGVHVLRTLLKSFSTGKTQFIVEFVMKNIIEIGCNTHGICLVKQVIEKYRQHIGLQKAIVDNSVELAQDPFGNYALQHLIDFSGPPQQILMKLISPESPFIPTKLVQLSLQKFSSNVIDKIVCLASESQIALILQEFSQHEKLDAVIQSQFGNFVLQNALNEVQKFNQPQSMQNQNSCLYWCQQRQMWVPAQSQVVELKERLLQRIESVLHSSSEFTDPKIPDEYKPRSTSNDARLSNRQKTGLIKQKWMDLVSQFRNNQYVQIRRRSKTRSNSRSLSNNTRQQAQQASGVSPNRGMN